MIPEVPQRTRLLGGLAYLLVGLIFTVYPLIAIWQDKFYWAFSRYGKAHRFMGWEARLLALAICCFGLDWILSSIRNLQQLQTEGSYYPQHFPRLTKVAKGFRTTAWVIFISWFIICCIIK